MSNNNVVSIHAVRQLRDSEAEEMAYRAQILSMDKLELLEEMIRFQEERTRVGSLNLTMMTRGKHLFKALEESAETQELKILTRSYRRHLEFEMSEFVKNLGNHQQ